MFVYKNVCYVIVLVLNLKMFEDLQQMNKMSPGNPRSLEFCCPPGTLLEFCKAWKLWMATCGVAMKKFSKTVKKTKDQITIFKNNSYLLKKRSSSLDEM